jgi:hypothetical protein
MIWSSPSMLARRGQTQRGDHVDQGQRSPDPALDAVNRKAHPVRGLQSAERSGRRVIKVRANGTSRTRRPATARRGVTTPAGEDRRARHQVTGHPQLYRNRYRNREDDGGLRDVHADRKSVRPERRGRDEAPPAVGRRTECRARKADEHTAGNGSRMPVRRGRVTRRCTPGTVGSRLSSRQADETPKDGPEAATYDPSVREDSRRQSRACIALRTRSWPRATDRTTNVRLAWRTLIRRNPVGEGGAGGQIGGGGPRTAPATVQRYFLAP